MKLTNQLLAAAILAGLAAGTVGLRAEEAANKPAKTDQKDAKVKPYPLQTCIVSGDKLGKKGKPVVRIYDGQEMKFCCKDCIKDFDKDPAKYIKRMEEEAKKQKDAK